MENEKKLALKPQAGTGEAPDKGAPENEVVSPGPAATAPAPPAPADLAAAYEKLHAEKDQLYDRLLRKQAELENLRKRVQREKEEFRQYAAEDLIRALLPTLDSFERALKHRDANVPEAIYQGIEMIYGELQGVLKRAGLVAIDTAGKLFDPHLHQAMETVEAGTHHDQEIVEELQRGYKLKHRVLRPAVVKVAVAARPAGSSKPAARD
jgi:molecular chaperone GrpE